MHFCKTMLLNKNSSKFPTHLHHWTGNHLSSVNFCQDDIAKIIQNLDPNKAHGHDNISISMLKICGSSIDKPLEMKLVFFLLHGKRLILFPFTKKGTNKQ